MSSCPTVISACSPPKDWGGQALAGIQKKQPGCPPIFMRGYADRTLMNPLRKDELIENKKL